MHQRRLPVATFVTSSLALLMSTSLAHGLPTGGQVRAGQAGITTTSSQTVINQTSSRAVINWNSFNVGSNEQVQFNQPSASSVTLNRVSASAGASQINGMVNANGNVWVINPGGVVFGRNAQVNVGGLLATTSAISDASFMDGSNNFTPGGNPNATVSNAGSISVHDAGLAALVAPNVVNSGTITAKLGKVQLALSDNYSVDLYGDGLINLYASPAITLGILTNSGTIKADGGSVALTAAAATNVVDSVINMDGVIDARTENGKTGSITIYAQGSNAVASNISANKGQANGSSTVLVSGTLDASGYAPGQTGGMVQVLGDNVGILSGARIDASGDTGGGTVRIGGDFHGEGTTPTARSTTIASGSTIKASAITNGNGGTVAVWSDGDTAFAGSIEARGGATSGDGGNIETSGHQLSLSGTVSANAPHGNAGTWLLDPNNVIINNTNSTSNAGSAPNFADSGSPSYVNTSDIVTALNGGTSVNVTASGSISVNNSITENTYNGTESLTLKAGSDITLANNVAISASGSTKLNVTLDSNTAGGGGAITLNSGSSIVSNGGDIVMGGGTTPSTGYALGDAANPSGILIGSGGSATVNAASGNIIMNGREFASSTSNNSSGVYVNGSTLQTSGTGTITISGFGDGISTGSNQYGITNTGTIESDGTGSITMTGHGGNGINAWGIVNAGAIKSTATGGGAITLIGYGGDTGGTSYASGTYIGGQVSSVDGHISITGTGGSTSGSNATPGQGDYGVFLFPQAGGAIHSTGTANIDITGFGGGTGASSGNYGFYMGASAGATLTSVSGNVNINGTGGNTTGGSDYGIYLQQTPAIYTTGLGNITFTGIGGHGNTGIVSNTTSGTNPIGGVSDTGSITFKADSIDLSSTPIRTSGTVTFEPYSPGTEIDLASGSNGLQITSGILGSITAGSMIVGATTDTGLLNVGSYSWATPVTFNNGTGDIDIANGSGSLSFSHALNVNTTTGNVNLTATTDINESGGGSITTQGGNAIFDTNSGGGNSGGIYLGSGTSIITHGGNILLSGGASPTTGDAGVVVFNGNDTLNAGAGAVMLRANGTQFYSIYLNGSNNLIETTSGPIDMEALNTSNRQAIIVGSGTTITTNTGSITIKGETANYPNLPVNSIGVSLGGVISSTGTGPNVGAIDITGTAHPNGGYYTFGIACCSTISSVDGNITLNGIDSSATLYASNPGYNIGLLMNGGSITSTGNGVISLIGTGDMTSNSSGNFGIQLGGMVSAHNGAINLTGTGGGVGSGENGIYIGGYGANFITSTGTAPINITGTGASGSADLLSTSGNTIGGASDTGTITFNANTFDFTSNTLRTAGQVIFQPLTQATSIGVAGGSGIAQITSALLGQITAGGITIGSTSDTALMTVNANSWNTALSLLNGSGDIAVNGTQTMGNHSFLADAVSGNIILGSNGSISSSASGNAITLASGGNFTDNNTSANALSATSGRWLVYSTNPANDNDGALTAGFRRFSCTYGGSCPSVPSSGDGLLYHYTPMLTATPDTVSVTYGSAGPSLSGYGYALSGYLGSDDSSDVVSGALNGVTSYTKGSHQGTYNINYLSGALISAMGYGFSYADNALGLTVNPGTHAFAPSATAVPNTVTQATIITGSPAYNTASALMTPTPSNMQDITVPQKLINDFIYVAPQLISSLDLSQHDISELVNGIPPTK